MTDEQRRAAAMADPDAGPDDRRGVGRGAPRVAQAENDPARALSFRKRSSRLRFIFQSGRFRDWEQGRKEPDAAARAYLRVIAREPEVVRRALDRRQA